MTPSSSPSGLIQPLRIFVVEDHPDTLKYYRLYLGMCGYQVMSAPTVAEALVKLPEAHCDVLISDLGLPDGTGWELLQRLREEGRPHPAIAIAVSGFGTAPDRERSRAAGFRHHLLKPFNPDHLSAILEEAEKELAGFRTRSA